MPITRLKRSRAMTSMAKFCTNTKTMAPMNGPIGWRMPPSTAITRMSSMAPTPTEPGEMRPLYQAISTPPIAASRPATV
jgi:hypothetical protein